jgi:hypothetical protein
MQLKILDQVHLSGVRASTLAAGEIVEVSDDLGAELMKKHPDKFETVADSSGAKDEGAAPSNKDEGGAPSNKSEPAAPQNKAGKRSRRKS